jgi:seryl-tRNA synthetase
VQKEIGQLKKVRRSDQGLYEAVTDTVRAQAKQSADELLQKKVELEKEKKRIETEATEKEKLRDRKCKTIGNYVHESVPINDNEVGCYNPREKCVLTRCRTSMRLSRNGRRRVLRSRRKIACPTTKSWSEQKCTTASEGRSWSDTEYVCTRYYWN